MNNSQASSRAKFIYAGAGALLAGCAGANGLYNSRLSVDSAKRSNPNLCIAGEPNCGHPTPDPTSAPTYRATLKEGTANIYASHPLNITHTGVNPSNASLFTATAVSTATASSLNTVHTVTFPGYAPIKATVYQPAAQNATSPTKIPTSQPAVVVYTDPQNSGAYATFSSANGNYRVTMYPNGSSLTQIVVTITGPGGTSSTIVTLPQSLGYDPHGEAYRLADLQADETIALRICCNCASLLGYGLAGLATVFFALTGLGLIVEIGALGGAAGVLGGSLGALGFGIESAERYFC